jgi:hypothetical protein
MNTLHYTVHAMRIMHDKCGGGCCVVSKGCKILQYRISLEFVPGVDRIEDI